MMNAKKLKFSPKGRGWIRPCASATELKLNILEDLTLEKPYHPVIAICVINVDCKIASKASASRLRKVILQIIYYDQPAYVQGRNIGESVRLIGDLIDHADKENLDGMLFCS